MLARFCRNWATQLFLTLFRLPTVRLCPHRAAAQHRPAPQTEGNDQHGAHQIFAQNIPRSRQNSAAHPHRAAPHHPALRVDRLFAAGDEIVDAIVESGRQYGAQPTSVIQYDSQEDGIPIFGLIDFIFVDESGNFIQIKEITNLEFNYHFYAYELNNIY